jgi:hypothetical protein
LRVGSSGYSLARGRKSILYGSAVPAAFRSDLSGIQ